VADFANTGAAHATGYKVIQLDRGAGHPCRYSTTLEKWVVGDVGQSGSFIPGYGESAANQAPADTQALAALNAQRRTAGQGLERRHDHFGRPLTSHPLLIRAKPQVEPRRYVPASSGAAKPTP
jgi:hypothetical protein